MATIRFTEDDRDSRGFIRLSPPEIAEDLHEEMPVAAPAPPARPVAPARPQLSPRLRYQLTIAAAGVAGLLLVLLSMRLSTARPMVATSAPIPTAAPSAAPTSAALPPAAPVAQLPAFAAPNGAQLGMIESTRPLTPTAHYGDGWIQADVAGSGLVWIRRSDSPSLAIVGPDLAPRPTATPAPIPPTATPEPQPPCLTAGPSGQVVTVCGWGDLEAEAKAKWLATYGGNVGTVITPSPYGGKP